MYGHSTLHVVIRRAQRVYLDNNTNGIDYDNCAVEWPRNSVENPDDTASERDDEHIYLMLPQMAGSADTHYDCTATKKH